MKDNWLIKLQRQLLSIGKHKDSYSSWVCMYILSRFQPNDSISDDNFNRQFSDDSSTSTSLGPDIYYDAQVSRYQAESFSNPFYQESIEGRISDAGLGAHVKRVSIAETQNVEMISMQNKHNMPLAELDHQDTLTQDIVNRMDVAALTKLDYSDEYCDSLEVFCQKRISNTHQALEQVQYLFVKSST